ncbi:unnamed protein product [Owenia fusiformis]|uniref:Uncharacterized protein n=1 Tax=Owenia fusiformis TaxID=6347 RepID=A0A8J1XJV2_OWEFU|nr:unnamed protein product [Owenia fusiformis]
MMGMYCYSIMHVFMFSMLLLTFIHKTSGLKCLGNLGKCQQCNNNVTHCIDTGYTNTFPLQYIPLTTTDVIFTGNNVSRLPDNIVGECTGSGNRQLKHLSVLDLSQNHIKSISGQAFHCMPNLKVLNLEKNDWQVDHHVRVFSNLNLLERLDLSDAFMEWVDSKHHLTKLVDIFYNSDLSELQELALDNNELYELDDEFMQSLCTLRSLNVLHLKNNKLFDLVDFKVRCLQSLEFLHIENNQFPFIHKELREMLDTVHSSQATLGKSLHVGMEYNPFNCDCKMKEFHKWLQLTGIVLEKDKLKCVQGYPTSNINKTILSLTLDQLQCKPEMTPSRYMEPSYTVLVVVLVLLSLLTVVVLYMNRAKVIKTGRDYCYTPCVKSYGNYKRGVSSVSGNTKYNYSSVEESVSDTTPISA